MDPHRSPRFVHHPLALNSTPTNLEHVPTGRAWCGDAVAARNDWVTERGSDIELCAHELLVNAAIHSTGNRVVVRISQRHDAFQFQVASGGPMTTHQPWPPTLVDPTAVSGRGLYLSHAVADAMQLTEFANAVIVTALFRQPA